jgi:hypothetical protein
MEQDEYIKERVDDQIDWYERKSQRNRKAFQILRLAEVFAAALIPFLAGYVKAHVSIQIFVGILGVIVAVIAGLLSLYRFQETWIGYRTTCESLKREKFLFLTHSEPYNVPEPFPAFVQAAESLMSKEVNGWLQYIKGEKKEKKTG